VRDLLRTASIKESRRPASSGPSRGQPPVPQGTVPFRRKIWPSRVSQAPAQARIRAWEGVDLSGTLSSGAARRGWACAAGSMGCRMGVAEDVIAALSGGGAAVARMEIARLVNAAVLRLAGRGGTVLINLETGHTRGSLDTWHRVAHALNVPLGSLMDQLCHGHRQ
jgi:hypothetical protein